MPATQLLGDKDLEITTYDVLPVNTVEGSWMQKKRKHSFSNTYLHTCLTLLPRVGNLLIFFV